MRRRLEKLICVAVMMIVVSLPGQEAPSKKTKHTTGDRTSAGKPTEADIRLQKTSSNTLYEPGNDQAVKVPQHKPVEKQK